MNAKINKAHVQLFIGTEAGLNMDNKVLSRRHPVSIYKPSITWHLLDQLTESRLSIDARNKIATNAKYTRIRLSSTDENSPHFQITYHADLGYCSDSLKPPQKKFNVSSSTMLNKTSVACVDVIINTTYQQPPKRAQS